MTLEFGQRIGLSRGRGRDRDRDRGAGRSGRDRLHHYRIAYGSAKEVDTHLRLLVGARAIDNAPAATALHLFDDVRAITWRLLHPR